MVTGTACSTCEWLLGLPSFSIRLRIPRSSQQTFLLSCLLPLEPFLSFPVSSPATTTRVRSSKALPSSCLREAKARERGGG